MLSALWLVAPALAQVETPRRRTVPAYPSALRGVVPPDLEVRCHASVSISTRGRADDVEVAECPQPYVDASTAALERWRWARGEARRVDVGMVFLQRPSVEAQRVAANPDALAFVAAEHLPSGTGVARDAGDCLPLRVDDTRLMVEVCREERADGVLACELGAGIDGSTLTWQTVQCRLTPPEGPVRSIEGPWVSEAPLRLVRTGPGTSRWARLSGAVPSHPAFGDFGVYRLSDATTLADRTRLCAPTESTHPPVIPRSACATWGSEL